MKRVSDLYEPKRVIKDIRRPSAYFSGADVLVSPHTPIGNLVRRQHEKQQPEPSESTIVPVRRVKKITRRSPLVKGRPTQPPAPKTPVFPAGFTLSRATTYNRDRSAATVFKRQAASAKTLLGLSAIVGTIKSAGQRVGQQLRQVAYFRRHGLFSSTATGTTASASFLPRKYTAQTGWKVDTERVVKWTVPVALIAAFITLLVLFLKPVAVPNSANKTTKARNASVSAPAENNVRNASSPSGSTTHGASGSSAPSTTQAATTNATSASPMTSSSKSGTNSTTASTSGTTSGSPSTGSPSTSSSSTPLVSVPSITTPLGNTPGVNVGL